MTDFSKKVLESQQATQLANVLVAIDTADTMRNFLRDVMTEKEITEISARLEAARLLTSGAKYTDIVTKTQLSSRTVARISDWLKNGPQGYKTAIEIANAQHAHTPPARAD